jgi:hypothetical protein
MDSKQLADFIKNNGNIGSIAGVVIGLISKDVLFSLAQDNYSDCGDFINSITH